MLSAPGGLSGGARTHGLMGPGHALYQLSYTQIKVTSFSIQPNGKRSSCEENTKERGLGTGREDSMSKERKEVPLSGWRSRLDSNQHALSGYSRFSKPLPYQLGLLLHMYATLKLWRRQYRCQYKLTVVAVLMRTGKSHPLDASSGQSQAPQAFATFKGLAEVVGFEPTDGSHRQRFSRPPP